MRKPNFIECGQPGRVKPAFEMPESYDGKLSRTVFRRERVTRP